MSVTPNSGPLKRPLSDFGVELRRRRKMAGLSQDRLAEITQFSQSLIGFTERGKRNPGRRFAQRCDDALEANGELVLLWEQLTRGTSPRWFRDWLDVEPAAHTLHTWQPLVVPGLLQIEDYARAVIRGEPDITDAQAEKAVIARMARQAIFERPKPPMFRVVLDEGVLYRPIGGKEVMCRQLERLEEAIESPRICIQIIPMALGVTTGILGGFAIAQIAGRADTVYIQSATHGYVTNRPKDVEAIYSRYETLRVEAQPQHLSIALIREAAKLWT